MCSWSILLLFHFVLFAFYYTMGLKSVERENNYEARNVPKCLQAKGSLMAKHRTSKSASAHVAKEDR